MKTCYVHSSEFQASIKCKQIPKDATAQDLENCNQLPYKPSAPRWAKGKDSQFLSNKMQTTTTLTEIVKTSNKFYGHWER